MQRGQPSRLKRPLLHTVKKADFTKQNWQESCEGEHPAHGVIIRRCKVSRVRLTLKLGKMCRWVSALNKYFCPCQREAIHSEERVSMCAPVGHFMNQKGTGIASQPWSSLPRQCQVSLLWINIREGKTGSKANRPLKLGHSIFPLHLHVCLYVHNMYALFMGAREVFSPLDLEFKVAMSCHVDARLTKPGSPDRAASALNYGVSMSLAPKGISFFKV